MGSKLLAPPGKSCTLAGKAQQPDAVTCHEDGNPIYRQQFDSNGAAQEALAEYQVNQAGQRGETANTQPGASESPLLDAATTVGGPQEQPTQTWLQSMDLGDLYLNDLADQGASYGEIQTAAAQRRQMLGVPEPTQCTITDPLGLGLSPLKPIHELEMDAGPSVSAAPQQDCSNPALLERLERKEPGFKIRTALKGGPLNLGKSSTGDRDKIQQKIADERMNCMREGR